MAATLPAGAVAKPAFFANASPTDDARGLRQMWRLYIVIGLLFGAYMAINDMAGGEILPEQHLPPTALEAPEVQGLPPQADAIGVDGLDHVHRDEQLPAADVGHRAGQRWIGPPPVQADDQVDQAAQALPGTVEDRSADERGEMEDRDGAGRHAVAPAGTGAGASLWWAVVDRGVPRHASSVTGGVGSFRRSVVTADGSVRRGGRGGPPTDRRGGAWRPAPSAAPTPDSRCSPAR